VAPELIGKRLVRRLDGRRLSGLIVEAEAYMGSEDPASHAFRGQTPRNRSMFGPPGHLYVYRSYGVHFCANVVTSEEGEATAVLLRALEPIDGTETMRRLRGLDEVRLLCSGPGRLCQALGIGLEHDGTDLLGEEIVVEEGEASPRVIATTRIGLTVARDRPWRFVLAGSRFTSRGVVN